MATKLLVESGGRQVCEGKNTASKIRIIMQNSASMRLGGLACVSGTMLLLAVLMPGAANAQAYLPSGTFQFTASSYTASPTDGNSIEDNTGTVSPSLLGARVTVTRSGGANGRVLVPVLNTAVTNQTLTTVTMFSDGTSRTTTVPIVSTNFFTPGVMGTNVLVFDDYQMSASLLLAPSDYTSKITTSIGVTNIDAGTSTTNVVYTNTLVFRTLALGDVGLDPLESPDLLPPTLGFITTETINAFPQTPSSTVSILSLERSTFRIDPAVHQNAIIFVNRSGGAADQSVTVNYLIDPVSGNYAIESGFGGNPPPGNTFDLEAGSDYALDGTDFTSVSGTLTWGAHDFNPKAITIPVMTNGAVQFNRDLQVALWIPSGSTEPAVVGSVDTAILTILSDSYTPGFQPAGAVDRTWNKDNLDGYDSSPPYLKYPGTKGGVSDTINGNGGTVFAALEQPDGKAVIAGSFNSFDSNPYNRIVRLMTNGYQDPTFLLSPNSGANDVIRAMALQPDGKIIIGGNFTSFNGVSRYGIARLNTDGSLDTSFNPGFGIAGVVYALALQTNGQVVVAGNFSSVNGTNMASVARLNSDGSLDTTFNPGAGPDGDIYAVVVDASGRVIIGGDFDWVAGSAYGGVARLNMDGSLDTSFSSGIGTYNPYTGLTDPVYALQLQGDQILVGGSFAYMELASYNGLVRLNSDGTIDTTFNSGTGTYNFQTDIADSIFAITLQSDGKILIGGDFTTYNQTRRVGIARLFDYGSLDTSFMDTAYNQFAGLINHYHNPDAVNLNDYPQGNERNYVCAIAVETNSPNNVIIGGNFLRVGGGSVFHAGLGLSGTYYPVYPDNGGIASLTNSGIFADGRMDSHPRSNVARLIGGSTPGPGNITLSTSSYSANKSDGTLYVSISRTNGSLGEISALCYPQYETPGPGIATTNDVTGGSFPTWPTLYSLSPNRSWLASPATFGPNYIYDSTYAGGNPNQPPDVFFNIINDTNITGNLNADISLFDPDGSNFTLGGEVIPLGAALGFQNLSPLTIIDTNIKPGTFGFSSPTFTVNQGGTAIITVTRANGSDNTVQVSYTTTNGTAVSPTNYTATSGTLTFGPGVLSQTFTVKTASGTSSQPDKTVNLVLYSPTSGGTLTSSNAVLTIVNNNANGHLAFTSATYGTNENAGTALITVQRLGGSSGTLQATFISYDGSAVNGSNYIASTNTLVWNNLDLSVKTISVPVLDDGIYTSNLTVNLRLTNGLLNTLANANVLGLSAVTNATLTIANVEFPGTVEFSSDIYSVKKFAGYALVPVVRTGGSAQTVTVNYATEDGTAFSGTNYTATSGTLIFTNGQVAQYFKVPIIDDGQPDGLLSLNLKLSNAALVNSSVAWNAQGNPSNAVLNIIDTDTINEPPGTIDGTYSSYAGFNGNVNALVLQTNNQLIVGGDFTMANGVPRQRLARLNADGTLDSGFLLPTTTTGANGQINTIALQLDGRILVGGSFSNFNSVAQNRISRLNYDGSLDSTFNLGSGADNTVYALAQSPVDKKILVGGAFGSINGVTFNGIGRLNTDGTPDSTFNPGGVGAGSSSLSAAVYAVAVQPDGKILIGGDFTTYNGAPANHIARLNTDGSLDTTFNSTIGANDSVRAITLQIDGKILVGGLFTTYNGTLANRFTRVNMDGSLDASFTPGIGADALVSSIAVQEDGRIILGGQFSSCSGVTRNAVTRLNPDGTVDPTINFGSGANGLVAAIAVQEDTIGGYPPDVPDEKIILGGAFNQFNGQVQNHLTRIFAGSTSGSGAFEFSSPQYQVNENGIFALISVIRTGGTSGANSDGTGDIYVPFSTSDGTAVANVNYFAVATNLDFPAGEVQQNVLVPVLDDGVITTNLTVNLAVNPVPPAQYGNQPIAELTINNIDSAVSFASTTYQVPKNVIGGVATINVSRLGSASGSASVVFNTTTNGTALIGTDYTPVTNALLTFNPGVTNVAVTIPINNNGLAEGNKTVGLALSTPVNTSLYSPSNATLTIIDTVLQPGLLYFAATNFTANSGDGFGYLTVIRTNGSSGQISVNFSTIPGTAQPGINYIAASNGTLTFANGQTSANVPVQLVNSPVPQGPVSLSVVLSNPSGGATLFTPTNAALTILNTNVGFAFLSATNYVRETNGIVPVYVQRVGGTSQSVQVNYLTTAGTAVPGVNYTTTSGTLAYAPGEVLKTISLPLIYDPRVTGDLTLSIKLSNPSSGTALASPTNTLIVVQDADAGLSFTNSTMNVFKNASNAVITVVCSNPSVEPPVATNIVPLKVNYATADGTAVAGVDYQAASGVLYFTNGIGTNTFNVPIYNNSQVSGNHAFSVKLLSPTPPGQLIAPSNQVVTIIDNNSGLNFSSPAYTVLKTGVAATITVLRTDNTNTTTTVNFTTADGSAQAGLDYVATNGVLIFTNGVTSRSFTVTVIASTAVQPDKTVLLQLSDPVNGLLISPYAATLTIHDTTGSLVVPAGSTFASGGDPNNNGLIDPGETVTLLLALRASGGTNVNNVSATLLQTNGVVPSGTVTESYGNLVVNGPSVYQPYTFTATGTNGQQIVPTLNLTSGAAQLGTASFTYTLGTWTNTYYSTNAIIINDVSVASPYPSTIMVSNVNGVVVHSSVTLTNLYHGFTKDIEALVVAPSAKDTLIMSHAGNGKVSKITLTFDDAAASFLSATNILTTGTNKPTQYPSTTIFP